MVVVLVGNWVVEWMRETMRLVVRLLGLGDWCLDPPSIVVDWEDTLID